MKIQPKSVCPKIKDTEGIIRSRKSKDGKYNCQIKKDKRTNNDLQNIAQKTKDLTIRTKLYIGGECRWSRRVSNSCSTTAIIGSRLRQKQCEF